MNRITFLLTILTFTLCTFLVPSPSFPQEKPTPWEVYYSPNGGCTQTIIKELNSAKISVLVDAYLFSEAPIGKAILDANKRRVKVQVILDKSQRTAQYSIGASQRKPSHLHPCGYSGAGESSGSEGRGQALSDQAVPSAG